jgi:autotransporter-associated beta strand protein
LANGNNAFVACGAGAVTFNAHNTYTGDTYVNGGSLKLNPAAWRGFANGSSLHLASGTTVDSATYYTPGSTLRLGNLSSITFDCSWAGGSGSAQIAKEVITAPTAGGTGPGTVALGSTTLIMHYDGSPNPVLSLGGASSTNQILTLDDNTFTINNNSYLPDGAYTLITNTGWYGFTNTIQPTPAVGSFGTFTVNGSAINPAKAARTGIVVSGPRVVLTINAPMFSSLPGNHTINHGDAGSLTLSGTLSDNTGASPVYPNMGETVYVSIGNVTQSTTINDATGDFSLTFDQSKIPGGTWPIVYSYLGNPALPLAATSDTTTYLIVNQVPAPFTLTSSANPSHGQSLFFTATLPADATGVGNGTGMKFWTNIVGAAISNQLGSAVNVSGSGGICISASTPKQVFTAGNSYQIWATWPGDVSYIGVTNSITISVVANTPPVANDATYTRSAGVYQLNITTNSLLSHASDADSDPLTLKSVTASTNGVTPVITNGVVAYYNTNNVADKFTYTVDDGAGGTSTANVFINLDTSTVFTGQGAAINSAGGPIALTFAGVPGLSYTVQRATDALFTQNVTDMQTFTAPVNGVFQFTDNNPPTPQAFYRLRWNP